MIRTIFQSKKTYIVLFVGLVLLGIVLRVDQLLLVENNYAVPDLNRDLLVGYHIAHYGEFTLLGPDSTSGLRLYNSPLFFIFTALTGLVFGFTTLGISIGNLVFQLLCTGLFFAATKNFFNLRTAFFATALMLVFDIFVNQSGFYWQPHLMQVVYMASIYVLSLGYLTKKHVYIYLSIFIFAASIATHYPSILVAPVFGIAVWVLLYNLKAKKISYALTALFGLFSMGVVFSTALFYRFFVPIGAYQLPQVTMPELSVSYYLFTVQYRLGYLISYYLPKADTAFLQYAAFALLVIGCVWYARTVRSKKEKGIFILLLAAVVAVWFGVTVTPFPYEFFVAYPLRYYTAVYIPLTMLIGVVLAELWGRGDRNHRIVAGLTFAVLLIAGGSYFAPQKERPTLTEEQHVETQFLFNDKSSVEQINTALLAAMQRYDLIHNIDMLTFDGKDGSFFNDRANDIIWFPLEMMTKQQLVTLDDAYLRSYRPLGAAEYLFVRCREVTVQRCQYLIREQLPMPYVEYTTVVEQLTETPDPSFLLTR